MGDATDTIQRSAPTTPRAPEPDLSRSVVMIDGHLVQLLCTSLRPALTLYANLLTDDECDALVDMARPRLQRSRVYGGAGGSTGRHGWRTGSDVVLERDESRLCSRLDARIAALMRWPLAQIERTRVLHYGRGQHFGPHHDFFDPARVDLTPALAPGGQRVATLLIYLNTPLRGGATEFPDVPVAVRARKGVGLFFSYADADAASRTRHLGAEVLEGEKWAAVKWFTERPVIDAPLPGQPAMSAMPRPMTP